VHCSISRPTIPRRSSSFSTFQPAPKIPDNIEFVNLAYLDAAYAAGALAALSSDKKKSVGFVGGDNPTQQGMMKAFVAAAERTVPGFKGLAIVTATITTPPRARRRPRR